VNYPKQISTVKKFQPYRFGKRRYGVRANPSPERTAELSDANPFYKAFLIGTDISTAPRQTHARIEFYCAAGKRNP